MSFPATQLGILSSPVPESALANVIKHTATARRTRERLREKTLALRDHMFASGLFTRHARFSPCLISRVSSDTTCAKNLAPLAFLLSPFCLTGTTILNNVHRERQTTKAYGINRR